VYSIEKTSQVLAF